MILLVLLVISLVFSASISMSYIADALPSKMEEMYYMNYVCPGSFNKFP